MVPLQLLPLFPSPTQLRPEGKGGGEINWELVLDLHPKQGFSLVVSTGLTHHGVTSSFVCVCVATGRWQKLKIQGFVSQVLVFSSLTLSKKKAFFQVVEQIQINA